MLIRLARNLVCFSLCVSLAVFGFWRHHQPPCATRWLALDMHGGRQSCTCFVNWCGLMSLFLILFLCVQCFSCVCVCVPLGRLVFFIFCFYSNSSCNTKNEHSKKCLFLLLLFIIISKGNGKKPVIIHTWMWNEHKPEFFSSVFVSAGLLWRAGGIFWELLAAERTPPGHDV